MIQRIINDYKLILFMEAQSEYFKGIEFIRISSLPEAEKERIWQSLDPNKIIKIVRDKTLLNDCILYQDYVSWLGKEKNHFKLSGESNAAAFTKLAFK